MSETISLTATARPPSAGAASTTMMRVASLCGSIKPLFSGTDDFHDNLVAVLRARDMDVRPVDLGNWGLAQVPALLRAVADERPDLILMQYPTDAFSAALGPHGFSLLQRLAPLAVTLHEFSTANPIRRISLSVLLARAAAVITTSEIEQESLRIWYPWLRSRSHVIPIGANFPGREWEPRTPPLVVHFGQVRPEKGLEDFLACQEVLASRFPATEFAIVGSPVPKFASYFETIASAARRQGIRLFEQMPPDRVTDYLRTATIALLPYPSGASLRRGSLLAAAVCGVPIVTLRGPDTPADLVDLTRPANSREGLIEQAATYLSNPGAQLDAHERSCRLAANVSWDRIGDSYAGLFQAIAARRATL